MAEADTAEPEPTIIVDDVHVVYRVWGASSSNDDGESRWWWPRRNRDIELRQVHAVRGVSLIAHRGEAIGLIGGNGSGKSTLLRAIAGGLPATSGTIYCNSRPTLLGVNAVLKKNLTGERNVVLGLLAMGIPKDQIEDLVDEIVEFSGIGDFIDLPMQAYSSGMAARLRFAIAAAVRPEVLLIDEALSTGDRRFKRRSAERVAEMRAAAGTVFLVHHSTRMIRDTCNRAIWLQSGRVVMDGPVDEVTDAYDRLTD